MTTLVNGDSRALIKELPENSIDLAITDPPWAYESMDQFPEKSVDYSLMKDGDLLETFRGIYRALKKGAHAYVFTTNLRLNKDIPALEEAGFKYHQVLVIPTNGMKLGYGWRHAFLPVVFLSKEGTSTTILHNKPNLFRPQKFNSLEKPLEAIRAMVVMSSKIGDVILDPFMGSGSVGVAALQMGREFVGYEIDSLTFSKAQSRIGRDGHQSRLSIIAEGPTCHA